MNPPQFVLGSRNDKDKRIVLANRRTLFTLTLATLALLWILQPNRALLIDVLDDAQDPTVALAFLRVLKDDSPEVQMAFAKQYARLDDYAKVLEHLVPLSQFDNTEYTGRAHNLYAVSLLRMSNDPQQRAQARAQLVDYLESLPPELSTEQAKEFIDFALQVGEPNIAYTLLSRQPDADEQQLLTLARQAGLGPQAAEHALNLYRQSPSKSNFAQALRIYREQGLFQGGLELLMDHAKTTMCGLKCLQQGIEFALSADSAAYAMALAQIKASRSEEPQDWLQASRLLASAGEIDKAIYWLSKANEQTPAVEHIQQLHEYYLWQSDTANALAMSKKLISLKHTVKQLKQGVKEALAQSDLLALSDFYYQLALEQELDAPTTLEWINYNDKAYGAKQTVARLEKLHSEFPDNELYWFQLARFYNFVGEPNKSVALWQKINVPKPSNYSDLNFFAQSFVAIGSQQQALNILHGYTDQAALNLEQLIIIQELATYTASRDLQRSYQKLRLDKNDDSLDPYLMLATYSNWDNDDITVLWQYYEQSQSPVILTQLLNRALDANNNQQIKKAKEALAQNHEQDNSLAMQLLRIRLAMFEQDLFYAKTLLQELLALYPENDDVQQNALWLAIGSQDRMWLSQLYWQVTQENTNSPHLYQAFAIAAQQLGLFQQAQFWFQRLNNTEFMSAADKLSWASLSEQQGNEALAQTLRWQVFSKLSKELKQSAEGEVSYRSLVSLFVSPALANTTLIYQLMSAPKALDAGSLLADPHHGALQKLAILQAHTQLQNVDLNDSVQLAIAIANNNKDAIYNLALNSITLSQFERASAMALVGDNETGWHWGEDSLGEHTAKRDLAPLQRFLTQLHPLRSHGLRYEHEIKDSWNLESENLRYYRPVGDGQWLLASDYDHGKPVSNLLDNYNHKSAQVSWRFRPQNYVSSGELGVFVGSRHGQQNVGQFAKINLATTGRISHSFDIQHNMPAEQSENLYMLALEDKAQWQMNWQPTRYEQLSFNLSHSSFTTDFGDDIATQWQGSLRLSEQFSFTPMWQTYIQYDHQQNSLERGPLESVSMYLNRPEPVIAEDFITPKYRRLAIGQQLMHGNVGEPGRDVPGIRYWLDTAIGYNFISDESDFSANAGLGVRIFGSDELFVKGVWQSADQNGRESLTLNIGYFYDF
ncbi:tetratricopeptide repeat protein [Pseudoalteromonas pernae]|uniref:tetratricopeptide repeat protein n=1 Tax=Pseudoalteromonas pernae TaxID=3118054 RepID=UPI003241F4B1